MRLATTNLLLIAIVALSGGGRETSAFSQMSSDEHIRANLRTISPGVSRGTLVLPGFTCVDTENGSVCKGDAKTCADDGACAYTELTRVADEQGNIATIKTCNRWDPDPTGTRRDGCITDTVDGFNLVSCVAEFENDSGTMTTCNICSRSCDDGVSASMDCTNVVPNKAPYTCEVLDLTDGGFRNFNGVPASSPTSTAPSPTRTGPTPSAPAPIFSGEYLEPEAPAPSPSAPDSGSVHWSPSAIVSALLGLIVITLL
jgi:hypothetical protein